MNLTKFDLSGRTMSFLPHEIQAQFAPLKCVRSNVTRLNNLEQFWNETLVGKLTCHKDDVFNYDDEDEDADESRYAYAVQFCPLKVRISKIIHYETL